MPTFPTYTSQRNINAEAPAPIREGEATQPFQNFQKVVGAVQTATKQWSDAQDVMQYTKAKADANTQISLLLDQANNDPELADPAKAPAKLAEYGKQMDKIRKDTVPSINNKMVAQKFDIDLAQDLVVAGIKIDQVHKNKQIDYARGVTIPKTVDGYMKTKLAYGRGSAAWADADAKLNEDLQMWVDTGLISYVEKEKYLSAERTGVIAAEISADPEAGLKKLQDNNEYPELTVDERADLISKANYEVAKLQTLKKEQEETTMFNVTTRILSNDINEEEILAMVNDGTLSPMKGSQLRDTLRRQITQSVAATAKGKTLMKMADIVFSTSDDRIKAYDAILSAIDGDIDRQDLIFMAELEAAKKSKQNAMEWAKKAEGWSFLRKVADDKIRTAEDKEKMVATYINQIRNGVPPSKAVQEANYEQLLRDHPALINQPEAITHIFNLETGTSPVTVEKPEDKK